MLSPLCLKCLKMKKNEIQSKSNGIAERLLGSCCEDLLNKLNISMQEVLLKCQETINSYPKKKKDAVLFKHTVLSASECCCFGAGDMPCLVFFWKNSNDIHLERASHILANIICLVSLETIIKGDTQVSMANITWINPDTATWIRNTREFQKGEIALDIALEKYAVKQSGDACLPVLHLLDISRSFPYGVKQVQELLGVASRFDQAIQASRKCFEKAAEKCHTDSLSNIVASCSWGKHVAVGTRSRFDVLWDKKEVGSNVDGGMDIYNVLASRRIYSAVI